VTALSTSSAEPMSARALLRVSRGADFFRSRVTLSAERAGTATSAQRSQAWAVAPPCLRTAGYRAVFLQVNINSGPLGRAALRRAGAGNEMQAKDTKDSAAFTFVFFVTFVHLCGYLSNHNSARRFDSCSGRLPLFNSASGLFLFDI
jgi:hypothetical protein